MVKQAYMHYSIIILYPTGYMALNLKDKLDVAQSIFLVPTMVGYSIYYSFGLVLSSQHLLLLVAGSYLISLVPYLMAEWLSNKRSFMWCLGSPESSHNDP